MNTTAPTITETRYAKLKAKLRELFELDKADLDFGIYRIMAAKNTEVTDFLDRQLKDKVRQTLAAHGSGELTKLKADLDKAIEQAQALGADPETLPKVQGLRERLEAAGGKTGEELEADIYNHLLAFFSRYYDEGDFISQRRYKGDTYAIPYSGEEVTLHWANKDQYYIKSGEWHKDYRFKLPSSGNKPAKRVQFALVDATQETNNNKEADESKRRYILVEDNPVSVEGDTLTLRFNFRAPTDAEKKRADGDDAEQPPVAIFGGKYEKSTKGDERERFCADAEQRAIPHIPADWTKAVLDKASTDAKPNRTLLGKHLDTFTARNTFDYFIHKDLGGFLSRELDFYIKNEVVRLDDLDTAPADHLQRIRGRVKAIRIVASSIIDLLASIENFQKKLWLKKKFVLNTSWLITIDRIPESLRDVVAENQAQWDEWEKLGFKPKDNESEGLFNGAKWGTRAYLDACDKLVVDTRLFEVEFTAEVLTSEELLCQSLSIGDAVTGVLVNGENLQALDLLATTFKSAIKCAYIDPPYNTGNDGFIYKDGYQESSWLSLLEPRLQASKRLLSDDGVIMTSIDDGESSNLRAIKSHVFGDRQFVAQIVWRRRSTPPNDKVIGAQHEYIQIFAMDQRVVALNLRPRSKDRLAKYRNPDNHPKGPWVFGDLQANVKGGRYVQSLYFPIINPETDEEFFPKNNGNWRFNRDRIQRLIDSKAIAFGSDGKGFPKLKRFLCDVKDGITYTTLWDFVPMNAVGTSELEALLPHEDLLENPKPSGLLKELCLLGASDAQWIMDFFAGSGSTAHAVFRANRENDRSHRVLIIEMGAHFWNIVRPRVTKLIYSPDWRGGNAKTHDQGLSALVKCFAVESYEDALNNLPAPAGDLLPNQSTEQQDALLKYTLDLEMGPNLLNLDIFRNPWGHTINAQLAGDDEIKRHKVDLVETFNYLLGLRVSAYGPIERYSAEFERSEHKDDLGRLKRKGRLKRDPNGPFKFHRVEGILNDESNTRVLVVWRTLTDDPEQDAAVLDAWMDRHREATTERSEHRDYHQIYINGPVTLPQPTAEIRTVYPIEETFKQKMFEDTDGVS